MSPVKLYRGFAEFLEFEPRNKTNEICINKKNENANICNFMYFNDYRKKMNIGFSQLSQDKCKKCKEQELHLLGKKNAAVKNVLNF